MNQAAVATTMKSIFQSYDEIILSIFISNIAKLARFFMFLYDKMAYN